MTDSYNVLLSTEAQQDLEEAAAWYQQQHEVVIIALLHDKRGPDTLKKRLKK